MQLVNFDEVKEIFGMPSGWMLYWGNVVVFGLVLLLFLLAGFLKYPDEVEAEIYLTTAHPPAMQVAKISETIAAVFVKEGEEVAANSPVLLLRSTADYQAMQSLDTILNQLNTLRDPTSIYRIQLPENLACGALRTDYALLQNYYTELSYWLDRNKSGQRIRRIDNQLEQLEKMSISLAQQMAALEEEETIAARNLTQFQSLFQIGAASQQEVDQAQTTLLRSRRQIAQQTQLLQQNQIDQQRLEAEKTNLTEQFSNQITEHWLGLKKQTRLLRQSWINWTETYIITTPQTGRVTFVEPLSKGQFVEQNTKLLYVDALKGNENVFAEGFVAAHSIGKIGVGSPASIQLRAYPYREFGQLDAKVSYISNTPRPSDTPDAALYRIQFELPQGLTSTYKKPIDFQPQLSGIAIVISENRSLLSRILDRFKAIRDRQL